ncbi:hypothetical protein QCA50_016574 [Cerrena zonata]|uniref:Fascin domain-containing protein n=1 Tax=Cerrena zonata TaxID=2478898 RepID=A0AAW0FQ45_9APHY
MHVPLETGYYKIINEEWRNFAAMYIQNGHKSGIVRAEARINNASMEDVTWHVQRLTNGNYFFCGARTPQLYAVAIHGAGPYASIEVRPEHRSQQWVIDDTRVQHSYFIRKTDNQYIWSLPDGEIGTSVILVEQANTGRSRWRFEPTAPPSSVGGSLPYSPPGISRSDENDETPTVLKGRAAQVSGVVAILNGSKQYMRVTSNGGLAFNSKHRDGYALFAVRNLGGKVSLINVKSGKHVNMYYINDVMCKGPGGGLSLGVYRRPDGRYNLTISGYQGQNGQIHYLSSEVGNAAYGGSLAVRQSIDDSCHLSIEKLIYIGFRGVIVLRNRSNYYMKVDSNKGLLFDTPVLDEDARFMVQVRGRKFCLIGNNGCHLGLHLNGNDAFVRCDGGGEGVDFAIHVHADQVCLTTSVQKGDGNETHYLSSVESDSGGYGSLEVVPNVNEDCWFRFENVSRQ